MSNLKGFKIREHQSSPAMKMRNCGTGFKKLTSKQNNSTWKLINEALTTNVSFPAT